MSRDDHAAVLLEDGDVLLAGGWGAAGVLASSELYQPRSGRFEPGPTMRSPRAGFTATRLGDGRVLVAGGFTGNRSTVSSAELYDPGSGTFAAAARMATARGGHCAVLLPDGEASF